MLALNLPLLIFFFYRLNMIEVSPVLAKVQFDRLCVMKSEKLPIGCFFVLLLFIKNLSI